mmetsp:Transcript_3829/g.8937  ORF Transcript_3829/g.8937 Transcript_3829/m.8937 type:complete len:147 (+) Transcript_3829:72-512(+)
MSKWWAGTQELNCDIQRIKDAVQDLGTFFCSQMKEQPSISSADVLEQGVGYITIKSNESTHTRTNVQVKVQGDTVTVEFDEEAKNSATTVTIHYLDEFVGQSGKVMHKTAFSGVNATGIMGCLYKCFGAGAQGKAHQKAYKTMLET